MWAACPHAAKSMPNPIGSPRLLHPAPFQLRPSSMKTIGTITAFLRRRLPRVPPFAIRHSPFTIPLLLLLASCATIPSSSDISQVHLFGLPVAVNMDQRPGPDGISVRVFASAPDKARGLPVRSGTLEILAFDGPLPPGKPLQIGRAHV